VAAGRLTPALRLRRFRADHPDIDILLRAVGGPWQAIMAEPGGKTVLNRWELSDLLDELDRRIADPGQAAPRDLLCRPAEQDSATS
jgi:hypothetical protein